MEKKQEKIEAPKVPTFDDEVKYGQEVESRLLGTRKFFQVHDYSRNMKVRIAIFNLNGRSSIWWYHCKQVKKNDGKMIVW